EQCEGKNRIEIEEQIVQPRRLLQKENIRRDQLVNERVHLKRPYQALNNSRLVEKDQNKRVKREICEITIAKEMVKAEEKNTLVANITKELNSSGHRKEVLELKLRQGSLQAVLKEQGRTKLTTSN
ncbi:3048_t:CDS:2, partial [Gigaspora margarita]